MYSKSDNLKIMINDEADEIIEELFSLLRKRYQNRLEMMKGSEFVFHYVHLFYQNYYRININCDGSYIDPPDCTKIEKATINVTNKKR